MQREILDRLQPVFHEIFDDRSLVVTRESSALTVEGWDSMTHVNLVAAVEVAFGVRFALSELEDLQSVGDMVELIARKLGPRESPAS